MKLQNEWNDNYTVYTNSCAYPIDTTAAAAAATTTTALRTLYCPQPF